MPNWCYTSIRIENPDTEILSNLENEFEKAFKCNKIQNGFGETWLGNILSYLGYEDDEVCHGQINCRGQITWYELLDDGLHFDTETAWVPMLQPFVKMVEKYAPDSQIYYWAEESGCEIFCTNDPDVVGGVHVDIFEELPEELDWLYELENGFLSKTDFIKQIAESMNWEGTEDEIERKIYEELLDKFSYHEWEYSDLGDWN